MKGLLWILIIAAIQILAGCNATTNPAVIPDEPAVADQKTQFNSEYLLVIKEYAEVSKLGGAWANTQEVIEKAEAAAKSNDYDTALGLLKQAEFETQAAKTQVMDQQNAGPYLF